MNKGNIGVPFEYSNSYIYFIAIIKIRFKIAYGIVHGIVRGLSEYIRLGVPRYAQLIPIFFSLKE